MDSEAPIQPFGHDGPVTGRDASGKFARGNTAALVVGHRSKAFWAEQAAARRDIALAAIRDAGYSADDCPAGLRHAADGLAQAVLIRDSAFERMAESGGPLTVAGRVRRAAGVWRQADAAVKESLKLTGVHRVARQAGSFYEALRAAQASNESDNTGDRT